MQRIKFPDAPEWVQSVKLDGKSYKLRARWNHVSESWTLDVLSRADEPLVVGIRIVRGAAMLSQFVSAGLPPGDFFAFDTGSRGDDYVDFIAGRALMVYITAAEVVELTSD